MSGVTLLVGTLAAALAGALAYCTVLRRRLRALEGNRELIDHRTALTALRASEEKFATAFHASPDAILLTAYPEGTILEVNEGFTRIAGWSRGEALGRSTLDLNLWAQPVERQRLFEELRNADRVRSREMTVRRIDGSPRLCLLSTKKITLEDQPVLLSVVHDITDLRSAEAARRASENKYAAAFRTSPDAIAVATAPDGRILDINEGFTKMLGYPRALAVGSTAVELGIWAAPEERDAMYLRLREEGEIRDFEVTARRRSGELLYCLITAVLFELDGQVALLSVVRDVTKLRRAENERETMIEELEAKNAELERFTYTVSHDLKSPLVTIRGFLGMLERHAESGDLERFQQDANRIRIATDRMRQLLDELLELSRVGRQSGSLEEVDLAELAPFAVEHLAGELSERGVDVEIAEGLPVVIGDRLRLLEVYQNLLTNAVKFLGDQDTPRIEIGWYATGALQSADLPPNTPIFFVRDNGVGIDPRFHTRIFGLFDRLDPSVPGTGVGLALVKRIVEVHGGKIWVESVGEGHGTTFLFTLGPSDSWPQRSS